MDSRTSVHELKEKVKNFCDEREWDKYHNAKDLAIGIIIEASELLEHFRFKSEKETEELFKDETKRQQITDEMADITFMLLRLAQRYNIDLASEFSRKMEKNAQKYPVDKSKGSNKKYTEL